MPKVINLTGQQIGRLLVLREDKQHNGRKTWLCRCECGNEKVVSSAALNHNRTRSCGCLRAETAIERSRERTNPDAKRNSTLYHRWACMIQRCENQNNPSWHNYGGRSIKVCEAWRNSYDVFIADMGQPPTAKHTIERIDNNGDYTPENCQWALRSVQLRNQRRSIIATVEGKTLSAKDWAEQYGIPYSRITKEYRRGGIDAVEQYIRSVLSR
jgi:hypothetical protein